MKKNALSCCLLEFNVAPFHLQRSAFGFVQDLLGGAHFAPGILCVLRLIFSCRQRLESFGSGLVRGFFVSWTFFFPRIVDLMSLKAFCCVSSLFCFCIYLLFFCWINRNLSQTESYPMDTHRALFKYLWLLWQAERGRAAHCWKHLSQT